MLRSIVCLTLCALTSSAYALSPKSVVCLDHNLNVDPYTPTAAFSFEGLEGQSRPETVQYPRSTLQSVRIISQSAGTVRLNVKGFVRSIDTYPLFQFHGAFSAVIDVPLNAEPKLSIVSYSTLISNLNDANRGYWIEYAIRKALPSAIVTRGNGIYGILGASNCMTNPKAIALESGDLRAIDWDSESLDWLNEAEQAQVMDEFLKEYKGPFVVKQPSYRAVLLK